MDKRLFLLLDIFFYLVLPLLFWQGVRDVLGDFLTILCSSFPGAMYSVLRYHLTKEINFTEMFMITNLIAGTLLDILSGTAIRLLWNNTFYSLGLSLIYLISILLKKPVFLLFALDIMALQGNDRIITKELFYRSKPFKIFLIITWTNSIREALFACIMMKLIIQYGVEAFRFQIILDQIFNILMAFFSVLGFLWAYRSANDLESIKVIPLNNKKQTRWIPLTFAWYRSNLEQSYFFFCNNKL